MTQSALGFLLRDLREERNLTLRELAQLAEVDHAYVYRLETGAKEAPSDEVISKLIRGLKAPKREAEMVKFLASNTTADAGLVEYVRKDATVTFDEFVSAASMVFRGTIRPDYATRIARVRRFLQEDDGHG
ncbi:transcriptional regulator with XRE-family HTH domain [Bradyrhizobium sp. i1.4.4]|uniref:helix-turn-helix domain-containing protein n=1 Tax=Bradyrhizobium sp. LA6.10 TaxID=3156318 RepID=UPI00339A7A7D